MDNFSQYVDVLIQAPIAVILIFFIYMSFKHVFSPLVTKMAEVIDKLVTAVKELSDVIKRLK